MVLFICLFFQIELHEHFYLDPSLYASVLDVVGLNAYGGFVLVLLLRYYDSFFISSMVFHLADEERANGYEFYDIYVLLISSSPSPSLSLSLSLSLLVF